MTKKEIIQAISESIGLTQVQAKETVQRTFDAVVETLVTEHRVELRNFGVFEVRRRAARPSPAGLSRSCPGRACVAARAS